MRIERVVAAERIDGKAYLAAARGVRAQPGDDNAWPVVHPERKFFDALAAVLVLRPNHQLVWTVFKTSRVEVDLGGQFLIDDRLRIAIEINTNARLFHGVTSSQIVAQDGILGMLAIRFAWPDQHPEHRHETRDRDGAGEADDDDVAPERTDQVMVHGGLRTICLSRARWLLAQR
jgi:hypothetical protein